MKLLRLISRFFKPQRLEVDQVKPKHFVIAENELGVKEVSGSKNNPRIVEYHSSVGLNNSPDEVAWCSSFVNWCLGQAHEIGTKKANARSFMNWGEPTKNPNLGDVVVFWRGNKKGWQGHVAFYVEENSDSVKVLGGNQSNKVCYQWYPKSQLLGFRKLA